MNASRPEAEPEYSRGKTTRKGAGATADARRRGALRRPFGAALAVAGAAALAASELLALYRAQTGERRIIDSVTAGAHHGHALLPIAALAIACAVALGAGARARDEVGARAGLGAVDRDARSWAPAASLVALGLVALGIALLADLPAVHRTGLLGTPQTGLRNVRTVAGPALYLETAGAIALLAGGIVGLAGTTASKRRRAGDGGVKPT